MLRLDSLKGIYEMAFNIKDIENIMVEHDMDLKELREAILLWKKIKAIDKASDSIKDEPHDRYNNARNVGHKKH